MAIVSEGTTTEAGRRTLDLASPATLEPIGSIECATEADVAEAIARARGAQPAWAARSFDERGAFMDRMRAVVIERQEEIIDAVVSESGKARTEAINMDIFAGCDSLCYYAKNAEKLLKPEKQKLHGMLRFLKKVTIHHQPLGVVGVITPWNGPFILTLNAAVQALMAGNTVVAKPSEVTPFGGRIVGELFAEAGLPEGVFNLVLGDGATGAAVVGGGVDKIHFTGSVATGRIIAEACGRQLIPCTLELGGKDPMIVLDDVDVDTAAGGALAASFMNTGQYCCGTERVYVQRSIADEFTTKVVEKVEALRQSDHGEFDVGAIFWDRQLEIIEQHLADAREKGATVLTGGRRNPDLKGLYIEPTVLTDVDHSMKIMSEETFGPIIPIVPVDSEDEAIELANDTEYGLSSTVWSGDVERAARVAHQLVAGSTCINDMAVTYGVPEAPFGGRKTSGVGLANGSAGLRGFCHPQPVIVDRTGGKQAAATYPYRFKTDKMTQRIIKILWGTPLGRWLS